MKKILMLATGGTIASRRTAEGLTPLISSEELLYFVPQVREVCQVDSLQLFNLDSTNITPGHWLRMASAIEEAYLSYDGFVICHGTDTMAYTAAALSYLVQNSQKPIVITGAQKPIDMEETDARVNLRDSFFYAASGVSGGVQLMFDGKAILGTRAKKLRTKSYNAFDSINYPILASVREGRVLSYLPQKFSEPVRFYRQLEEKVGMMKLIPGQSPQLLEFLLEHNRAVIIESFGSGGLPDTEGYDFYFVLEKYPEKTVVMTTQSPIEGSDLAVYHVGRRLKEMDNVLESFDMTLESVTAKLMWALPQCGSAADVKKLFYTPVGRDIYTK